MPTQRQDKANKKIKTQLNRAMSSRDQRDVISFNLAIPEDLTEDEKKSPAGGRRVSVIAPDGRVVHVPADLVYGDLRRPTALLTFGEKIVHGLAEAIRSFSQQWITHVLLVLLLFAYTALGGLIFQYVEAPHERNVQRGIDEKRNNLSRDFWELKVTDDEAVWYKNFSMLIRGYESALREAYVSGVDPHNQSWSYVGALFFSGTVYTTVGYGNVVPSTDTGRGLTIIYACIGIPLLLTVLADLGKVFTRGIKYIWAFIRRFYYTGSCRRVRSAMPMQAMERMLNPSKSQPALDQTTPAPFVVDENFDLPVSLALLLLFTYILLGAVVIMQWEDQWNYFHAVYFVFVSLTTIGFGDMVPQHPAYLMVTFIYLLFGLALTSMCINVVQESLSNTFRGATQKLTTRIGLLSATTSSRDIAGHVEVAAVHLPLRKNKSD